MSSANMGCCEVQSNLSLYLYGELEFAEEEALEQHLGECPMCQLALSREKLWHTNLKAQAADVPPQLLAECRRDLQEAVRASQSAPQPPRSFRWHWPHWLNIGTTQWSSRLALASFFVFVGIVISHWTDRLFSLGGGTLRMSLVGTPDARIRDIQPTENGRVRIVVDRLQEQELVGSASDQDIRRLLIAAARTSTDPGLRIDSVELLKEQGGDDIRDALLTAARHDQNAAVRLKALDSLRRFHTDAPTRETLIYVLEHDQDASVRSQAIDLLLPRDSRVTVGPDLLQMLEGISRSDQENDYVRARCIQVLRSAGTPNIY